MSTVTFIGVALGVMGVSLLLAAVFAAVAEDQLEERFERAHRQPSLRSPRGAD
jgi:hypothetical protein